MANTTVDVRAGHSRRRIITIVIATVLVVAVGVVIGLWRTVGQSPSDRDLTLPILKGTTWDPNVSISYTGVGAATEATRVQMKGVPGADRVAVVDNIWIQPRDVPDSAHVAAHLVVARLGPAQPDAAVAAVLASERELAAPGAVVPMTNLPAGWQGIASPKDGRYGDVEVLGVAGTQLVRIAIGSFNGSPAAPTATVARAATQLVRAIATWGIPRFSRVVSRPKGWW